MLTVPTGPKSVFQVLCELFLYQTQAFMSMFICRAVLSCAVCDLVVGRLDAVHLLFIFSANLYWSLHIGGFQYGSLSLQAFLFIFFLLLFMFLLLFVLLFGLSDWNGDWDAPKDWGFVQSEKFAAQQPCKLQPWNRCLLLLFAICSGAHLLRSLSKAVSFSH